MSIANPPDTDEPIQQNRLWHDKGWTARVTGSTVAIPAGLIDNGESIIFSEATYDYDSPVDDLMPAITRFSHTSDLRPRLTEQVTLDTN